MKKCKNCGINDAIQYSKYTTGEFCSSKCARGYSTKEKRKEINEKVSKNLTGRKTRNYVSLIKESKIRSQIKKEYQNITFEERCKLINEKRKNTNNNKILNADYSTLKYERLRKRIILEQNNKCNKCGLNEWLGENIIFELEHIDGDHSNNERTNLEALCPNCHSLTPTWRGRNKNTNIKKITDDELFKALYTHNFNIRQSLLSVGLAGKGGNYKRCYRLKKEYEEIIL